jgi:hypothetical protein
MASAPKAPKGRSGKKRIKVRLPVPIRRPIRASVKAKARAAVRGVQGLRKVIASGIMRSPEVERRARHKRPLPGRSNDPFAARNVRGTVGDKVKITKRPLPGNSNVAPAAGKVPAALADQGSGVLVVAQCCLDGWLAVVSRSRPVRRVWM